MKTNNIWDNQITVAYVVAGLESILGSINLLVFGELSWPVCIMILLAVLWGLYSEYRYWKSVHK